MAASKRKPKTKSTIKESPYKWKIPKTIPKDIRDPVAYVRGYNGCNKCPKNTNEIRKELENLGII